MDYRFVGGGAAREGADPHLSSESIGAVNTKELRQPRRKLLPSSKRHPCPICGRDEDGDCRLSADLVLCYRGKHRQPPAGLVAGSVVAGRDRQQWAYTGESGDRKWALFTPDKPRAGAGPGAEQKVRAVVLQFARLPRPAEVPPADLPDGFRLTYSPSQWVTVRRNSRGKRFIPTHRAADGAIATNAGQKPWPLWRQSDAVEHGRNRWIFEAEGEKCANWIAAGGLVAISQPGHAHTFETIADRYGALVAAGVAGVAYLADKDEQGQRKAEVCAAAARAVGLPFLIVPAAEVWPDLPEKGSIDDADGTAPERVEQLSRFISSHRHQLEQEAAVTGFPDHHDDDSRSGAASTAAADLPRVEPSHGKAVRLAPDQVLQILPQRVGRLRLNVRTREVHTKAAGVLSGNAIGRLYLNLSSRAEVWPKDATVDAVAELAHRDQFDPVAEYLNGITADPLPLEQWQRLDRCLLEIKDPIAASFLPRYFISAVARVFEPGCEARQLPVLVGPQWRGKTALGRILFGGDQWVDGLEDLGRDALMRAQTAWGVELSELDGITRRSDQEKLKATISAREDTFRAPYERAPERRPRGSVPTYAEVADCVDAYYASDADPLAAAWFVNPADFVKLTEVEKVSGSGKYAASIEAGVPYIKGIRAWPTSHIPAGKVILTNPQNVSLVYWRAAQLIRNPFALDTSGGLRLTVLNDVDVVVQHRAQLIIGSAA